MRLTLYNRHATLTSPKWFYTVFFSLNGTKWEHKKRNSADPRKSCIHVTMNKISKHGQIKHVKWGKVKVFYSRKYVLFRAHLPSKSAGVSASGGMGLSARNFSIKDKVLRLWLKTRSLSPILIEASKISKRRTILPPLCNLLGW